MTAPTSNDHRNGHLPGVLPPGLIGNQPPPMRSSYIEHLPGVFHRNEFLGRFLLIFETILAPIDRQIANLPNYFDPDVTPPEVLDWLGSWLNLVFDERVPLEQRRETVKHAVSLYRRRGTRGGLAEFIRVYTGIEPEIDEPTLSDVARDPSQAFTFTVRMTVPQDSPVEEDMVRRLIDAEKPSFARARLIFRRA